MFLLIIGLFFWAATLCEGVQSVEGAERTFAILGLVFMLLWLLKVTQ